RDRGRDRTAEGPGRRLRRVDGRHRSHLGGLRRLPGAATARGLARTPSRLCRSRRLRPRRSRPACPSSDPLRNVSIVLVGISYHQAPIELRERAALDPARAGELARRLAGETGEAVCLSTCNRTELYLAEESGDEAERKAE